MRAFKVDHAGHPALGYVIGSRTTSGLKKEYKDLDWAAIRDLIKMGVSIKEDPVEKIEVAYTGDTCAQGLMNQQSNNDGCEQTKDGESVQKLAFDIGQMFKAELLLSELTFLDSSEDDKQRQKASDRGHLHIKDLKRIFSSHMQWREGGENATPRFRRRSSSWPAYVGNDVESDSTSITQQYPKSIVFYHLSAKYQPARRALDFIAEGLPRQLRSRCHVAISSMLSNEEKSSDDSFTKLIQSNGCISLADYLSWEGEKAYTFI